MYQNCFSQSKNQRYYSPLYWYQQRNGPKPLTLLLIFGYLTLFLPSELSAQCTVCPELELLMINGCGPGSGGSEPNEFVVLSSGSGFNTNDLELDLPNNSGAGNDDINLGASPCGIQFGLNTLVTGCPNVIAVGPNFDIPANSLVLVQIDANANTAFDFSAMCGAGECVYVVRNTCARTSAAFANGGSSSSGTRTTTLTIDGCACTSSLTYDLSQNSGTDGDYFIAGGTYGNDGCDAPRYSGNHARTRFCGPLG